MIANYSWLTKLSTPVGDLTLNAAAGNRYLALNESCTGGADIRVTVDMIPQGDGQLIHPQWLTGYTLRLAFALWQDGDAACGRDAQDMLDEIGAHIDALRNPDGNTRVVWSPTGLPNRMVNDIALSERAVVKVAPRDDEAGIIIVSFAVASEFPYEMSEAEGSVTVIPAGTGLGTLVANDGNTQTWPVFRVDGPTNEFWIENLTTGKLLHYDGDQPGAPYIGTSQYVEIDMFRGTVVLNGDGDDSLIAGIDFSTTEFWALAPGTNEIAIVGATTDILYNHAYL